MPWAGIDASPLLGCGPAVSCGFGVFEDVAPLLLFLVADDDAEAEVDAEADEDPLAEVDVLEVA